MSIRKTRLIAQVCDEILAGKLDDQFPLVIWQTGSGTQSNMNVNEVIANRAHVLAGKNLGEGEKTLAPNDDVNKSQSSNDTFPTGMHIAVYKKIAEITLPGVRTVSERIAKKVRKLSRRCENWENPLDGCHSPNLGTRVFGLCFSIGPWYKGPRKHFDTSLRISLGRNCRWNWNQHARRVFRKSSGLYCTIYEASLCTAQNKFEALAAHDAIVETHGALNNWLFL